MSGNDLSTLQQQLQTLTDSVIASERRVQRMERRNRVTFAGLLGALGLSLYLGFSGFGGAPAMAENALENNVDRDVRDAAADLRHSQQQATAELARSHADFDKLMENMRRDLNRTENAGADAGKAIAVLLHDIKKVLAAVPSMATNMETMSRDMTVMTASVDQMNHKMTVMTAGINSTMGRMGRMMPWW